MANLVVTPAQATELILRNSLDNGSKSGYLVGISGIDGSGKGYVAQLLAEILNQAGNKAAVISIDGWLNLPQTRFSTSDPGRHFYEHATRFEEMFSKLVLPLQQNRSIEITTDFTDETATSYRKHPYCYEAINTILLEGIFLFKTAYRSLFDLTIWIDCTFETALQRAITRRQEGLTPDATVRAYERIYFPAQRIHFERDHPRQRADLIVENNFR